MRGFGPARVSVINTRVEEGVRSREVTSIIALRYKVRELRVRVALNEAVRELCRFLRHNKMVDQRLAHRTVSDVFVSVWI